MTQDNGVAEASKGASLGQWSLSHTGPWDRMLDEYRNLAEDEWVKAIALDPMSCVVSRDSFKSRTLGFAKANSCASIADALCIKVTRALHAH